MMHEYFQDEDIYTRKLKVVISGQKYFGEQVLRLAIQKKCEVIAVCCPVGDKYIGRLAAINHIPIIPSGTLTAETMPDDIDLGIAAHSFDFIGRKTRYKAKFGWIGYHPSLLPRHRGKSSIEWAIRMGDPVTGGTIYWLNNGLDRGDIAYQDWCFIDPKLRTEKPHVAAKELWCSSLLNIGVCLFDKAISDIQLGKIIRSKQDEKFATFEPSTELEQVYKPDLLMLKQFN